MTRWIAAIAVAAVTAVAGTVGWHQPASAQSQVFDATQVGEIQGIVREYLISHPEVLREAFAALEAKEQRERDERFSAVVAENGDKLFRSPDDVVLGNPEGDVTLVEFFDYNCGYCQRALPDLAELLETDSQLRVVLKEFPILTPGSIEAAKVAIAVARQGRYWDFHRKLLGSRGQADKQSALAVAESLGFDMNRLRADMESDDADAIIEQTHRLASELGIEGTPAYVIGDRLVPGAVGVAGLRQTIEDIREAACASC